MAIQTPAADRLRPADFDQVAGQQHLVGKNGILRRLSDSGHFGSMIFFGPPGTGKTTCATIIAQKSGMELRRLNATTASLSDVKAVAAETEGLLGQNGILLYLDEIQYFNKKQQQSLLEYIEDGRITLIASTTEIPTITFTMRFYPGVPYLNFARYLHRTCLPICSAWLTRYAAMERMKKRFSMLHQCAAATSAGR